MIVCVASFENKNKTEQISADHSSRGLLVCGNDIQSILDS